MSQLHISSDAGLKFVLHDKTATNKAKRFSAGSEHMGPLNKYSVAFKIYFPLLGFIDFKIRFYSFLYTVYAPSCGRAHLSENLIL